MKMLTIAIKDFIQSTRSLLSVGMMIVAPLLLTGLVGLAFGGTSQNGAPQMTDFSVALFNLDQGVAGQPAIGSQVAAYLESDQAPSWLKIQDATSEAGAREAVRRQKAAAALIIPANFSQEFYSGSGDATLTLVHDPAAGAGLQVFSALIHQVLQSLYGTVILSRQAGADLSPQMLAGYSQYLSQQTNDGNVLLQIKDVNSAAQNDAQSAAGGNPVANILSRIMAGMLIFFVFFSGANGAQSLLHEEELQTLPRLFTTPTSRKTILTGKILATWLTILVQSFILLVVSNLLFHIDWGNWPALALVVLGLSLASTGFGVFLLTFANNSRQAGMLTGGVLSVLGMVGGLFTAAVSNLPAAFLTINLCTPQGWAMRGLSQVLDGAGLPTVLPAVLITALLGLAFFAGGLLRFQRRLSTAY